MATELAVTGITSGSVVVAEIRQDTDEQIWRSDTLVFETYGQTNQTAGKYDVLLTEQGTSGYYVGDMPTGITTAGYYNVTFLVRTGSVAPFTYSVQTAGTINWD